MTAKEPYQYLAYCFHALFSQASGASCLITVSQEDLISQC